MPKICENKCKESTHQEFQDDETNCGHCNGPLKQIKIEGDDENDQGGTRSVSNLDTPKERNITEQSEFKNSKFFQEFNPDLVNSPKLVLDLTSKYLNYKNFPIVCDTYPQCEHFITIQFYTIVLECVWNKTDLICLRIGTDNFENYHGYFLPIRRITRKDDTFILITGCIKIPSYFIDSNSLDFPYKYYFYNNDGPSVYEDLHHHSNNNYYRHFYRGNISESDTETIKQFDIMIIPSCTLTQWVFSFITNSVPYTDFLDRVFVSLLAFLPTFMQIGYFPTTDKCASLEDFIPILLERLDLLLRLNISFQDKEIPWNTIEYIDNQGKPLLIQRFIEFLLEEKVENSLERKILCIYLAMNLFVLFKLKIDETIPLITHALRISISEILSNKELALKCLGKLDIGDVIIQILSFSRFHCNIFFPLLALYHTLFFPVETHNGYLKELDYTDILYWGIPPNVFVPKSSNFSQNEIWNALKISTKDQILSYSIVFTSLDSSNLDIFKEFHCSQPNVLPLSAFISFVLYQLYIEKLKPDLLMSIVNFLITRLESQSVFVSQVENFFFLSLKLTRTSLPKHVINQKDLFNILNLLALQSNNETTTDDIDSIFNFTKMWHKRNIDKNPMSEKKFENEILFWNKSFEIDFTTIEWSRRIEDFLKIRLKQFIPFTKLFTFAHENCRDELKYLFNDEMIRKLKESGAEQQQELLNQLINSPKQLKGVSKIFSNILLLERERFSREKLLHLLKWPPWANYFTLANTEEIHASLDEEAKCLLKSALDTFSHLIKSILDSQIKMCDTSFYREKENVIKNLAKIKNNDENTEKISSAIQSCHTANGWIEHHLNLLEYLRLLFDKINFKCKQIEIFLKQDLSTSYTIAELVEKNGENFRFIVACDSNIESIVANKNFNSMATSARFFKDSVIFIDKFNKAFLDSRIPQEQELNLDVLFTNVWIPTVNEVDKIVQTSLNHTILLSDVQSNFPSKLTYLSTFGELETIYSGIQHARSEAVEMDPANFTECCENIDLYFELSDRSTAAAVLIQLRKHFSLETDFNLLEEIQNLKENSTQKPLSIINDELKKLNKSLLLFTPKNIKVLSSILEDQNICFITWANTNLKDLNELKAFVEIALATTNAASSETDRVMKLNSVCTNLAAFIFNINKGITYHELIKICTKIFSEVKSNENIMEQLRYVSTFNKYWASLKTSQGSLEENSLMKLDNIASFGVFTVSTKNSQIPTEMVSLITTKDNIEEKYDMEQLTDLKSKLSLVVSKNERKNISNSQETDKKTAPQINTEKFSYLCAIFSDLANVLCELLQIGVITKHYTFNYKFTEDEQKIDKQIERARKTLDKHKQIIEKARGEHHFLNYYTISQIVILQEGLYSYIKGFSSESQELTYHLLRLLNTGIISIDIKSALVQSNILQHTQFSPATSYPHDSTKNKSKISEVQTADVEDDFSAFSPEEKVIAKKFASQSKFPRFLIINAIDALKSEKKSISGISLTIWCHHNQSPNDSVTVQEDSPEEFDDSSNDSEDHISIIQLGEFLKEVYKSAKHKLRIEREFCHNFKLHEPNLIFVPNQFLFESVLCLYQNPPNHPLPFYSEVLLSSEHTSVEEIDIFWRRALYTLDSSFYIFCLVGIENLNYQVSEKAVKLLRKYLQLETNDSFKLVIICCEEKKDRSFMATALEHYERVSHFTTDGHSRDDIHQYLYRKFTQCAEESKSSWLVDEEKSRVRLVVSDSVGAGKSLYINNLKSDLLSQGIVSEEEMEQSAVTVAIHGKQASEEHLAAQLLKRRVSGVKHGVMYHVDIASTVQLCLEPILFKLLILGGICKRSGELWHCRGRDYYVIEATVNKQMLKFSQLFPTIQCVQQFQTSAIKFVPKKGKIQSSNQSYLDKEEYRRTFAYLNQLRVSKDFDYFNFDNTKFCKINSSEMSRTLLNHCGIEQPSWTEINNFVMFLNKQLSDCENSSFCDREVIKDALLGFKSFVVKFMIHMSRDFATQSLRKFGDVPNAFIQNHRINDERRWENCSHPYIFFNPDRHTMTFLGFQISDMGHLIDSENINKIIEENIIANNLLIELKGNFVDLNENYQKLERSKKLAKLAMVMDIKSPQDPNPSYVLTLDNIRKILAILMRFRCNIPVVIMGETGCGKTHLIQFMCSLQALQTGACNMLILKVHGGTTETDVMSKVEEAVTLAEWNYFTHQIDTVLFFDEANTSPAIGLIKEIMCDRRMYGRHIRTDIGLQFIAACNPYRRHTEEMLNKLSSAGLGFFTKASETTDRLGDIPLRELVYRVMELPASLRPLVWDFGQLSNNIEKTYIVEIVAKHLRASHIPIEPQDGFINVISGVLTVAQNYMKEQSDECSFVSLRDVERTMRVMLWFYGVFKYLVPDYFDENISSSSEMLDSLSLTNSIQGKNSPHGIQQTQRSQVQDPSELNRISYSLVLALAVCYRARLQSRKRFDQKICVHFKDPLTPIHDYKVIDRDIDRCQQVLLDHMSVAEHIAKNKALRENVFMMFVCIELKIPLFVIGKPGSSKSLAKSIIFNNMQGNKCQDNSMLRNFKAVHIMSYQCSQLSTAEGIVGVFESCKRMQNEAHSSNFVSCVVLDEVGLAEDSPLLPLKVLHPLLEDTSHEFENKASSTEKRLLSHSLKSTSANSNAAPKGCNNAKSSSTKENVAFIGISNWSLDPAKMNRGIMVTRGDPDEEELLLSAKEICKSKSIDPPFVQSILDLIPDLAKSYLKFVKNTDLKREYHGLRDFYSLIKMLVFLCEELKTQLNESILTHSILRNFGGSSNKQLLNIFMQNMNLPTDDTKCLDNSPVGLIRANLSSSSVSFHGEARYLLLLTENYAALNIVLKEMETVGNASDHVRVLFGSHFPRDQDYSSACRNINKIKLYMETGKTVILLHLELLYESLYDTLNQYYMRISNQRYIDLGLGTHRMKCQVHERFKLIVIAEKDTVYETFPTPLINRLEKHLLTMPIVLPREGVKIAEQLAKWAYDFSHVVKRNTAGLKLAEYFSEGDCFVGYHSDTPYSIVFEVFKERKYSDQSIDQESVLNKSQVNLLKMAAIDAIFRLNNSALSDSAKIIQIEYFKLHQDSLGEYLKHILETIRDDSYTLITTHSRMLTDRDVELLTQNLCTHGVTSNIRCLSLPLFHTEYDFTRETLKFLNSPLKASATGEIPHRILLVQCEGGTENAKLIACARHKTADELKDWHEERNENMHSKVCVVFLVPLQRESDGSKFVSQCGGNWNTVHIDDIHLFDFEELPPMSQLYKKSIDELFEDIQRDPSTAFPPPIILKSRLKQCIQPAISRLVDTNGSEERALIRLQQFEKLLQSDNNDDPFYVTFCQRLTVLLKERSKYSSNTDQDWLLKLASCEIDIQSSATFRKVVNLHINSIVIPLVSELLAILDRNGNLSLTSYNDAEPPNNCLYTIWQDIFRNEELFVLSYYDTISPTTKLPRRRVPVLSNGPGGMFFKANFPFSFLIQESTDNLWQKFVKEKNPDQSNCSIFEHHFLGGSQVARIFQSNMETTMTDYEYKLYLMDFLHMKIAPRTQEEYSVYEFVILSCVKGFPQIGNPVQQKLSVPNIHYAYYNSKQLLTLLQQAFEIKESLVKELWRTIFEMEKNNEDVLVELLLLETIRKSCDHYKERTARKEMAVKYVAEIRRWESIVQELLRLLVGTVDETVSYTIQNQWHRITALQLIISHCYLSENEEYTDAFIEHFKTNLNEIDDFTSVETAEDILILLSHFLNKCPSLQRQYGATSCFINILTEITFRCHPEKKLNEDLFEFLVKLITIDEEDLKELENRTYINIYNDCTKDNFENPNLSLLCKTYLFQLMINQRKDIVQDVFIRYLHAINPNTVIMKKLQEELFVIFIQIVENSIVQNFNLMENKNQWVQLDTILNNEKELSYPGIYGATNDNELSYELMERIANLKSVCIHISHWLIMEEMELQLSNSTVKDKYFNWIKEFNGICRKPGYESLHLFFLKNLYHQLGTDTQYMIVNKKIPWTLIYFKLEDVVKSNSPDYFCIYGDEYKLLKSSVQEAYKTQTKTPLLKHVQCTPHGSNAVNIKYLLCSIFQIFTETMERHDSTGQFESFEVFKSLLKIHLTNDRLAKIGLKMLSNNLMDGRTPCLKISPESTNNQIALVRLIYHVAVLKSTSYHKLFEPISRIYDNPCGLIGKYFPTLAEEKLSSISEAMKKDEAGKWYVCRNGHPYLIGESACNPSHAQICLDCGAVIDRERRKENATRTAMTRSWYKIRFEERKINLGIQRSLSPASVTIIRALINITFIWSCSEHPADMNQLLHSLTNGVENNRDLPTFFYQHLERDMRDLAALTGKNFEEATFLLHLVIKSLMQTAGEPCTINTVFDNHALRDKWEKEFDDRFIQPVLTSLFTEVHGQINELLSDINGSFFRNMLGGEVQNNPMPHLWLYRSHVSLEHFSQSYAMADRAIRKKCPFIQMFLKEKHSLFATQYLPDIVELQQRVGELYVHRLSKYEATNITIQKFLENGDNYCKFEKLINTLIKAWNIIGEEVKKNGRLRMEETLEQKITSATSLAYLLASSTGEGVLITSLTDYLVLVHNSFAHTYRDRVKGSRSDKVPLREVKCHHVIKYEEQLQSLLLSHAHYSLALGQGSVLTYDFEGVERQLMEQLFQDKPLILAEHMRFEYIREAYNLAVFDKVRFKVQQRSLRETIWRPIQDDLDSLEVVSDVLLVLDVVIAFLSERGGNPEQKISSFLHDTLEYPIDPLGYGPLQSRSADEVMLAHVLSFWTYLSVEKARKLSILRQNLPFSSLGDKFQGAVSEEEITQIKRSCEYFPVEKVLFNLHDFILFYVRETRDIDAQLGLKQSFEKYAKEMQWKLHHGFSRHFPGGIKLSQCNAVWAVLARQEHDIFKD